MNGARGGWLVAYCLLLGPVAFGADLPEAPKGFVVREVVRFEGNVVRLTGDGDGKLLAMNTEGDLWRVDVGGGAKTRIWEAKSYVTGAGEVSVMGMAHDRSGRVYVVANRADASVEPHVDRVTIYRTEPGSSGTPQAWFEVAYPYGVDTFNHGVSRIECGPDGMMYVSSGSRTDHGEARHQEHRSTEGEVPMTGCIWRLDPGATRPQAEIYAAGLRNAFGFCFDEHGVLWATENGPNGEAAEELNRIVRGGHYGFPYRFENQAATLYPDQPGLPQGLTIMPPVANDGPDAGEGLGTFDNHSSPSGIVHVAWPAPWGNGFLVGRFGNLLGRRDVGFDLLFVRIAGEREGRLHAGVKRFMPAVGRVTDLAAVGGAVYVCVYDMATANVGAERVNEKGGRILEVRPE